MLKARLPLVWLLAASACTAGAIDGGGAEDGPDAGGEVDDQADAAAEVEIVAGRVYGTGGVGLNLRAQPSTEAEVLELMAEGTLIDLVGPVDAGWYRVRHGDLEGYSSADFIVVLPEGASEGGLLNLLPWTPGKRYEVTQQHGGFSHNDDSYWAWDFGMAEGTPVLASHNGVVRLVKDGGNRGCCDRSCGTYANYVILDRGDGIESNYHHLSKTFVTKGQVVVRGDVIGESGATGYVCGAHLHFQFQKVPSNRDSAYSPAVSDKFYDTGEAFDPKAGTRPLSQNGVLDIP